MSFSLRPGSAAIVSLIISFGAVACSEAEPISGGGGASSVAGSGGANDNSNAGGGSGSMNSSGGSGGSSMTGGAGGMSSGGAGGMSSGGTGGMSSGGTASVADAGVLDASFSIADAGVDAASLPFDISSPDFDDNEGCGPDGNGPGACGLFANDNTSFGADVSPAFNWTPGPAGTQSYALVMHDLNFIQNGLPFTHWVLWNIPASELGLTAALPSGEQPGIPAANTQQLSVRGDNGYAGSGGPGNVYEFVLYALSTPTFDPGGATVQRDVELALVASANVLAAATMRGRSDPQSQ